MSDAREKNKKPERPYQMALRPEGIRRLEELRAKTGMSAVNINERLFEWFTSMPVKFALGILQKEGAERDEMLIAWFRETMQAHGKGIEITEGDDVVARLRLAHQILNEVEMNYSGLRKATAEMRESHKKKKG